MLREAGLVLQTAVKLESEHGLMDEDKLTAVKYLPSLKSGTNFGWTSAQFLDLR
jgi:hypothetical protein